MRHIVIAFALLIATVSASSAQTGTTRSTAPDQTVISGNIFGLGGAFSIATGSGISFRHHLPLIPFSYQLTGYAWNSGFKAFSIGAELQYDLLVQSSGRLYVLAGLSRYGFDSDSTHLDDPNRLGVGVGYELPIGDAFGVSLNLTLTSFQPSGEILPLPGAGAYIYF